MSETRDPQDEQQIVKPPPQPDRLRVDTGDPNDDRSHLIDVPPTQVDEDAVSEKTDRESTAEETPE